MAITRSEVVEDRVQRDGRRSVHEQHADQTGQTYDVFYMAEAAEDVSATLALHASALAADLTQQELQANYAEVIA